jgi:hypothetical protein
MPSKKTTADRTTGLDFIPPDQLFFDGENPRLVDCGASTKTPQPELMEILWKEMAVDEVAMSIAVDGYWEYEPLIGIRAGDKVIVIEGNRRLAAVKLLLDPALRRQLRATDLPPVSPEVVAELRNGVPVNIVQNRREAWRYLGFKHVNGPAKWNSYAKAQYISQVHNEYQIPLPDIAEQIGDKHRTVQRLYRALMVIDQAEKSKVFNRANRYKGHFAFSHLYTGLDYSEIENFLALSSPDAEKIDPVPKPKLKALGELCLWLFGDKRGEGVAPVVRSQNPDLRQLAEVLSSPEATDTLRAGMPLSLAVEVSKGDDTIFRSSLTEAKLALQKAHSTMSTGYDGDPTLMRMAEEVANLSYDLAEEMERRTSETKRRKPKGQQ